MGQLFLALAEHGQNGALRWIGGTLTVLFCWFVGGGIILVPFLLLSGGRPTPAGQLAGGNPFWVYLGTDLSFLGIWLGLWLALRFIHQRPFLTLVTSAPKINWTRAVKDSVSGSRWRSFFSLAEFALYPARVRYTFKPACWFVFLPFVLILTPIQTSAEELLFRGYGLQGVGRLSRNWVILVLVNGLLFALPHMLNPEVVRNPGESALLFLNYFGTGGRFAFFVLRDNRLEAHAGYACRQ